jgi:AI-2 transport protein TqsA
VIYIVLNFVVTSLVQPHFIGDAVGLSVTITFVGLVFWGWLLRPVGAVLAIPLTLLAKALLVDTDPSAGWAAAPMTSSAGIRRATQLPDTGHQRDQRRDGGQDDQHLMPREHQPDGDHRSGRDRTAGDEGE